MAFIRRIKKKSGIYLAKVESYRENGKVKQRVIKYLGKEIEGKACRKTSSNDVKLKYVKEYLNILCVDKLVDELGIKDDLDKHFLLLIYSQILENKSINKLQGWVESTILPELLDIKEITTVALYDSLTSLSDSALEVIMLRLSKYFLNLENSNNTAVIDVTDTYFEGKSQDGRVRKGKDGRIRKLAQFALAVSLENGFPLHYQQYSGNLSDIQIFKDMNIRLSEYGLNTIVVDRGMTSIENLKLLSSLNMKGILGLRKNKKIEREFIDKWPRNKIQTLDNRVTLKKSTVYAKSFRYLHGELIIVYNPHTELQGREKSLDKNKEPIKSYGYSLIFHDTDLSVAKVVATYYEKDTVERAFKQLKGVLKVRPVRFWLQQHIGGHFKICYLAYAVLALMKYKLKRINVSPEEALDSLQKGYVVRLKDQVNNHEWDLHVPLQPHQKKIVKALGVVYKN